MTTTVISSGNYQDTAVSAGQTIVIGPFAAATTDGIESGGVMIIMAGAADHETAVSSGGIEILSGGSSFEDGFFTPIGGTQVVLSDGDANSTTVGSGGQIVVSTAGEVSNALVSAGGTITVFQNGEAAGDSLVNGAVEIVSGGLAFGEVVNGGGILTVSTGAADGTTLLGTLVVSFGGSAAETAISSGGLEAVDAGAATNMDSVFGGGVQSVASHGLASSSTVFAGGSQTVASGGSAVATVLSGGLLVVNAGGSATDARIAADGSLDLQAGAIIGGGIAFAGGGGMLEIGGPAIPAAPISGFAAGDTIDLAGIGFSSGSPPLLGPNNVLSFTEGGSSYTLNFDPEQSLSDVVFTLGADAAGTQVQISAVDLGGPVVSAGETLTVSGGQTSSLVMVDDGGAAVVSSGGLLSASLVTNGGVLRVEAGGAVSGITVAGSAIVDLTLDQADEGTTTNVTVEPHGVFGTFGMAISTTVNGGTFNPTFKTSAVSTTINSGGVDHENGTGIFTTVNSGGSLVLSPADGSEPQTISTTISGGDETVEGLGTVTDTVIDGGVLNLGDAEFPGAISAAGGIGFGAAGGTLVIGSAVVMSGAVISGFAAGDTIDLTSLAPGSATIDTPGDVLTVSGGGATEMLQFAGDYSAAMFQVTGDTGSGSLVTELPCYAAGTHIATEHGEVPVEALAPGDMVLTHAGGLAPVRWVGHRRVDCRRHPRPRDLWPVRVRAGAFGRGVPHRDLLLSPDHAVFIGGVLIPVRYLANGATVIQEIAERVAYWHVELDRHSVILAEGLPCESYLDTGNRAAFANGGAAAQMRPDFALRVWEAKSCAPLVLGGAHLAAAKRHLLAQAGRLGHDMTGDPGLQVLVDGREVAAEVSQGRQWRVRLPATAQTGRLVSRVWVPSEMRPDEDDARSLGVAISRVWRDRREVSLGSDGFSAGWHAPEPGWRWTDGNARLALADARELAFEVAMSGTYWQPIISTRRQRPQPAVR